jgi:hypothetical protein
MRNKKVNPCISLFHFSFLIYITAFLQGFN